MGLFFILVYFLLTSFWVNTSFRVELLSKRLSLNSDHYRVNLALDKERNVKLLEATIEGIYQRLLVHAKAYNFITVRDGSVREKAVTIARMRPARSLSESFGPGTTNVLQAKPRTSETIAVAGHWGGGTPGGSGQSTTKLIESDLGNSLMLITQPNKGAVLPGYTHSSDVYWLGAFLSRWAAPALTYFEDRYKQIPLLDEDLNQRVGTRTGPPRAIPPRLVDHHSVVDRMPLPLINRLNEFYCRPDKRQYCTKTREIYDRAFAGFFVCAIGGCIVTGVYKFGGTVLAPLGPIGLNIISLPVSLWVQNMIMELSAAAIFLGSVVIPIVTNPLIFPVLLLITSIPIGLLARRTSRQLAQMRNSPSSVTDPFTHDARRRSEDDSVVTGSLNDAFRYDHYTWGRAALEDPVRILASGLNFALTLYNYTMEFLHTVIRVLLGAVELIATLVLGAELVESHFYKLKRPKEKSQAEKLAFSIEFEKVINALYEDSEFKSLLKIHNSTCSRLGVFSLCRDYRGVLSDVRQAVLENTMSQLAPTLNKMTGTSACDYSKEYLEALEDFNPYVGRVQSFYDSNRTKLESKFSIRPRESSYEILRRILDYMIGGTLIVFAPLLVIAASTVADRNFIPFLSQQSTLASLVLIQTQLLIGALPCIAVLGIMLIYMRGGFADPSYCTSVAQRALIWMFIGLLPPFHPLFRGASLAGILALLSIGLLSAWFLYSNDTTIRGDAARVRRGTSEAWPWGRQRSAWRLAQIIQNEQPLRYDPDHQPYTTFRRTYLERWVEGLIRRDPIYYDRGQYASPGTFMSLVALIVLGIIPAVFTIAIAEPVYIGGGLLYGLLYTFCAVYNLHLIYSIPLIRVAVDRVVDWLSRTIAGLRQDIYSALFDSTSRQRGLVFSAITLLVILGFLYGQSHQLLLNYLTTRIANPYGGLPNVFPEAVIVGHLENGIIGSLASYRYMMQRDLITVIIVGYLVSTLYEYTIAHSSLSLSRKIEDSTYWYVKDFIRIETSLSSFLRVLLSVAFVGLATITFFPSGILFITAPALCMLMDAITISGWLLAVGIATIFGRIIVNQFNSPQNCIRAITLELFGIGAETYTNRTVRENLTIN